MHSLIIIIMIHVQPTSPISTYDKNYTKKDMYFIEDWYYIGETSTCMVMDQILYTYVVFVVALSFNL